MKNILQIQGVEDTKEGRPRVTKNNKRINGYSNKLSKTSTKSVLII